MNNYVISLTSQDERRAHIIEQFRSNDIEFNFFDAIDHVQAAGICRGMDLEFEEEAVTLKELGCFMSHLSLWQKIISEDLAYLVIFEDDVVLSGKIRKMLNSIDNLLPAVDIIRFETTKEPVLLEALLKHDVVQDLYRLKSPHMGTGAYLITNKGARYLVQQLKDKAISTPIDVFIFKENLDQLKIYQLSPAVVIQDSVLHPDNPEIESMIEQERKLKTPKPKIKLPFKDKVLREVRRLKPNNMLQKRRHKLKQRQYVTVLFEEE